MIDRVEFFGILLFSTVFIRVGLRDPEVRESRKIPKFGNPESRKSQSRNFGIPEIPKISIPNFRDSQNPENFGIPELRDPESFRDFPKIPENYAYVNLNP